MSRLIELQCAVMDRNPKALLLEVMALEPKGANDRIAASAEHWVNREAQFDIEGAIDWRDLSARRCGA